MLEVEVQYLEECPVAKEMMENVKSAIIMLDFEVEFIKTKINHDHDSDKSRGCPTLLVNGRDYEGKIKFDKNKPFCREYRNGLPSIDEIKKFIQLNY